MKMIIVLDKICLVGVIGVSLYAGYKLGRRAERLEKTLKTTFDAD